MPRGSALTQKLPLSDTASAFFGKKSASRAEFMKAVWNYVRENNLKGSDGVVECDEVLAELLGVDEIRAVSDVPRCLKEQGVFLV